MDTWWLWSLWIVKEVIGIVRSNVQKIVIANELLVNAIIITLDVQSHDGLRE